jgi:dsDNA-binding SOS-regulon protein
MSYTSVPAMVVDTLGGEDAAKTLISMFVQEVERRAEDKMLLTGKLEGSHYAAMKQVAEEWSKL